MEWYSGGLAVERKCGAQLLYNIYVICLAPSLVRGVPHKLWN